MLRSPTSKASMNVYGERCRRRRCCRWIMTHIISGATRIGEYMKRCSRTPSAQEATREPSVTTPTFSRARWVFRVASLDYRLSYSSPVGHGENCKLTKHSFATHQQLTKNPVPNSTKRQICFVSYGWRTYDNRDEFYCKPFWPLAPVPIT